MNNEERPVRPAEHGRVQTVATSDGRIVTVNEDGLGGLHVAAFKPGKNEPYKRADLS